MTRILRRPQARDDLLDIHDYIAASGDEQIADAVIQRIEQKLTLVAQHPELGRRREELRAELRSTTVGRYIVFYVALEDGIEVVRVLYGGRDLQSIFADDE